MIGVWEKQGVVIAPVSSDTPGQPNVLYEAGAIILSGTVFKMWFGTANGICYAESADGLSWTRYSGNPIVPMAQGYPRLFKNGGTYYLYTTTVGSSTMAVYTSTDGVTFTLANANGLVQSQSWEQSSAFLGQLAILEIDTGGTWYGYYSCLATDTSYKVGLATSTDGIHWTKSPSNPIIDVSANFSFQKVGSAFYGWTQILQAGLPGFGSLSIPSDIGRLWATAPGGPWTLLPLPTLYRTTTAEGIGSTVGQVADPSLIAVGGDIYIFYTINDQGTGNSGYQIALSIARSKTFAQLVATYEGILDVPTPTTAGLALELVPLGTDDFHRADANPIGSPWSRFSTSGGFSAAQIVSDVLEGTALGVNTDSFYNAISWPDDQWSEVVLGNVDTSGVMYAGIILRASESGALTSYRLFAKISSGRVADLTIQKALAGSFSQLADVAGLVSPGDVLTGSAIGDSISLYQNGNLLLTVQDSDIPSGGAGLLVNPDSASLSSVTLTSWRGGGVQVAPTPPGPPTPDPTPPTSIREQIMVALIAALSAGGAASPSGLTVHRERTRPIEIDSLPAIMVYADDDVPKPLGNQVYAAPLTERQFSLALECRAQGTADVSPDAALDPVLVWAAKTTLANEKFGGLANGVEEGRTVWSSREGDVPVAAAKLNYTIRYRTSRLDPTSKS